MKELFPFILAIAYFAFKQYKKGQENKSISQSHNRGNNGKDAPKEVVPNLDDFITSFFGEQGLKPEVEPVIDNERDDVKINMNVESVSGEVKQTYSIEYDDNTSVIEEEDGQFEMIKNKDLKSSQSVDFDLRNAVIYDAILNPPYISR